VRKHRKDEQEFLENIDRLIAGEEVSISDDADDDLRTSIEFSRSLSSSAAGFPIFIPVLPWSSKSA